MPSLVSANQMSCRCPLALAWRDLGNLFKKCTRLPLRAGRSGRPVFGLKTDYGLWNDRSEAKRIVELRPQKSGQGLGEVARRDALQVEPGQELLDRLGPPEVGRQDRRGETDLAGLSRTPAVAHPGAAHRDRIDAGLNPALAMMAVANDTAPARIVLQSPCAAIVSRLAPSCAPERNTDGKGSSENDPG